MNPYTLLLGTDFKFRVVDTRQEVDNSQFLGTTTSTWKKVFTAGQRRYANRNTNLHDGNTYILTYEKGRIVVVNPGKGDYVPPGYELISRPLEEILRGYDGSRCVARSRLVPLEGAYLFNAALNTANNRFCVYRNQPNRDYVRGWSIFTSYDSASYYCYIVKGEDGGIKCQNDGNSAMASQTICKESIEGKTSLRLRCEGTTVVMLGTDPMTRDEYGIWNWEGEPIVGDILLSVRIGSESFVRNVEFLDD